MKKILSLVLAAMMVLTMAPAVFADEVVAEDASQYQEAIDFLANLGIWKGTGTEAGDAALEAIQRYQMANLVARVTTGYTDDAYWATPENDSGFDDIDIGDFAGACETVYGTISYAAQKGIIKGVETGKFAPADGITYRDAQTMLVRALGFQMSGAAYPWGFITKAQELGLTEGLTGIGHTDELNRGQVAQLIYNALFAEVNGTTFAEKAFGVEKDIVLITASNKAVYEADAAVVTKTGYIRFSEIDAQGEPVGTPYHAKANDTENPNGFQLADVNAASAAVGTLYSVYHKNNYTTILSAEPLSKTFENRGHDNITIKADGTFFEINGVGKWAVASAYTNLTNNQGEYTNAAGDAEIKVYSDLAAKKIGLNTDYIVASNGDIYKVGDLAISILEPWAVYSEIMDAYYGKDAEGNWRRVPDSEIQDILAKATTGLKGFGLLTKTEAKDYISAYATAIISDVNDAYTRVNVREYRFGLLQKATRSNVAYLDMYYSRASVAPSTTVLSTDSFDRTPDSVKFADVRWTGLESSVVTTSGVYAIYYYNQYTKEVEILDVIGAGEEATGSYVTSGYLRNYDASQDTIVVENKLGVRTEYTIGYNELEGALLRPAANKSKANIYENINIIRPLINNYINVVVVDGKVVHVEKNTDAMSNLVIIDKFNGFGADGIYAHAYSTVVDEWVDIVVGSVNGWSVGGYAYDLYYLSNLFPNNKPYQLPVELNTFYTVVYVETVDGQAVYNLTSAAPKAVDATIGVNKYNFIVGTDGNNGFGASKYKATADGDDWLIVDMTGDKVVYYTMPGKVKPVLTITGADVYKAKDNDYLLVLADPTDSINGLSSLTGKTTDYVLWNEEYIRWTDNNYWFNPDKNAYEWTISMDSLKSGDQVTVTIDPVLFNEKVKEYGGWNGLNLLVQDPKFVLKNVIGLEDGKIYKISDRVLYSTEPATIAEAAAFYALADGYAASTALTVTAADNLAAMYTKVATKAVELVYDGFGDTSKLITDLANSSKVKIFARHAVYGYMVANDANAVAAAMSDASAEYVLHVLVKSDGQAIAWLFGETATTAVAYDRTVAVRGEEITVADKDTAAAIVAGYEIAIAGQYEAAYNTVTMTLTAGSSAFAFDAATDTITVWTEGSGDVVVDAANIVVEGGKFASATVELVGAADDSEVHILIDRAVGNDMYLEFVPQA